MTYSQWSYRAKTDSALCSGPTPLSNGLEVLTRCHVLITVTTLILDGSNVSDIHLSHFICADEYNIRLLSIRDVTGLKCYEIWDALRGDARPFGEKCKPKLKGLYYFNRSSTMQVSPELRCRFRSVYHTFLTSTQTHVGCLTHVSQSLLLYKAMLNPTSTTERNLLLGSRLVSKLRISPYIYGGRYDGWGEVMDDLNKRGRLICSHEV